MFGRGPVSAVAGAGLLCWSFGSVAHAFPPDAEWRALRRGGTVLVDPVGDRRGGSWAGADLVGTTARAAGAWAADDDGLYLRLRVEGDPLDGGAAPPGDAAWAFLLDLDFDAADGDDADWEVQIAVGGADAAISVYGNPNHTRGVIVGLDDLTPIPGAWGDRAGGQVRFVDDGASDWYVDVALAWDAIDAGFDLVDTTSVRVAVVAGLGTVVFDVAGCDDRSGLCDALTPQLADAFQVDGDEDGLTSSFEASVGLRPDDADSDDDGLIDGREPSGPSDDGVHPGLDCDSDGDGLRDGTERGVTAPHAHTDVSRGCWRPDVHPSSTTDMLRADTDGGGIPDGVEDLDRNGRVDAGCWETDPNDPADDVDTDGDGVADVLEAAGADGEIDDVDSDGDGISDAIEGTRDPDRDCIPAFLDLDSDGDGYPDALEGGGDLDQDGLPDSADADADGDGRPDAWEGDDDIDCDGLIDRLDRHDFDGFCDSPLVDTGPVDPPAEGREPSTDRFYGGGACQHAPHAAVWWMLLPALLVRRRWWGLALAVAPAAHAQQADVQRFSPALGGRFVRLADPVAPLGAGGGVGSFLTLADDPLVYRDRDVTTRDPALVGTLWTLHGTAFANLGPVTVGAVLPVHLRESGDVGDPLGARLGDVGVSARAGFATGPLAISPWVRATLPSASDLGFGGSGRARLGVGASVGASAGPVALVGEVGGRTGSGRSVGPLVVSPALTWGAGASGRLTDAVSVGLEVDGEWWSGNAGQPGATPAEWLASARFTPPDGGPRLTVGMGSGLSPGVGAPDFRAVFGLDGAWGGP